MIHQCGAWFIRYEHHTPHMAGAPQGVRRARQKAMESTGIADAGTYSVQESGTGVRQMTIPAMFCDNFGVDGDSDVRVYIDFDAPAIIAVPAGADVGGDSE